MFRLILTIVVLVQMYQCAFFDMTDVDDPLALLWQTKETMTVSKSDICKVVTTQGTISNGKCTLGSQCFFTGGKSHYGPCGVLSTCCIYEQPACGKVSSARIAYFESTLKRTEDATMCKHTVKLINKNICQIRLDFEVFSLTPASFVTTTSEFRCQSDNLIISPNFYNIPALCGGQADQHVYVHLDNTTKQVDLTVNLATRNGAMINPALIDSPQWRIKMTQLECPGKRNFFEKHTKTDDPTVPDFDMLAPVGAVQYFTKTHGVIRSFGFNVNQQNSPYTSPQNYIMAFKRYPHSCRIRFKTNYIKLHVIMDELLENKCGGYFFGIALTCAPEDSCDIIEPGSGKVCIPVQLPAVSHIFTLTSPGPLILQFFSGPPQLDDPTIGFDITYDIEYCDN